MGLGEGTTEEMRLWVFPSIIQWRRLRDVLWGRVFHIRVLELWGGEEPSAFSSVTVCGIQILG